MESYLSINRTIRFYGVDCSSAGDYPDFEYIVRDAANHDALKNTMNFTVHVNTPPETNGLLGSTYTAKIFVDTQISTGACFTDADGDTITYNYTIDPIPSSPIMAMDSSL